MKLVDSINEALLNAQAFSRVGEVQDSVASRNFGRFFHWYYFSNLGLFAPSKFIGYKNTNLDNYQGDGTGGDTQRVLSQWFVKIDSGTKVYNELKELLKGFAAGLGKTISKRTFDGTGGIYLLSEEYAGIEFPNELARPGIKEGALRQILVNAYERSPKARNECINHYGAICSVCNFDFEQIYGKDLGGVFIHVHHIVDLAHIGEEYEVDPIEDLLPVCPNCHAMLHKRKPAMHPDELRKILRQKA